MTSNDSRHTGDATLLRKVNESAVLEMIREQGPISRSDLARRLHLSPPTVTRIVNTLIKEGVILESQAGDSSGGRRPMLLEFNHRSSLIIGVYVGQNMVGALADLNGEILERRIVASVSGEGGIERLVEVIRDLHDASAQIDIPVRGVGVGAPSITHNGLVKLAPSLGWRDLPLKQRLEERVGLPVYVENEVNLIALGENWCGAGKGIQTLICISLGSGIGAGIILNGQLYRGSHSAAGEVGYLMPNERYLGRTYDTFGCLESLAGSNGIVQSAMSRLSAGEPSMLTEQLDGDISNLTAEMVLSAARDNDALACAVVDETVNYLSIAVANLACILDPERIVISGDLANYGDLFIEPILSNIHGVLPEVPDLVVSSLKMDAPVLGAVAIALRQTSGRVFVQPARA